MIVTLLWLIFLILALVIGWHIIFALLGGAIVIGSTIWGVAIVSVVAFSIAVLLAFIITGLAGLIIGGIFAVWTLIAVILFPVLFPILLPLFIIYGFIAYFRKKSKNK